MLLSYLLGYEDACLLSCLVLNNLVYYMGIFLVYSILMTTLSAALRVKLTVALVTE